MKQIRFSALLLVLGFLWLSLEASHQTRCEGQACVTTLTAKSLADADAKDELQSMTVQVKKIQGKERRADRMKAHLLKVNGVKQVEADVESGKVVISYNKAELGCCSKVHTALEDGGWQYTLVVDTGESSCCAKKTNCSKNMKKSGSGCGGHDHKHDSKEL